MPNDDRVVEPGEVVTFWFGDDPDAPLAKQEQWWAPSEEFDAEVERRFEPTLRVAADGKLSEWRESPESLLALVIVFDQFPRNIYRGTARAFAWDERALELTDEAIETGMDTELSLVKRWFLYLPLMHSESLDRQEQSVQIYDELRKEANKGSDIRAALNGALEFAREHRDIVEEFGRFPHRNQALGRESSEAERAYLDGDGATYGQ